MAAFFIQPHLHRRVLFGCGNMASSSKAEVEEAREIDEPHVEVTWKGENESDSEYVLSMDKFPLE